MVFELAAYGLVAGLLYRGMKKGVYPALVIAMVAGRLVSGAAKAILFGMAGKPFGMAAFLSGAFTTAIPGIILQLVLLRALVLALERSGVVAPARAGSAA